MGFEMVGEDGGEAELGVFGGGEEFVGGDCGGEIVEEGL